MTEIYPTDAELNNLSGTTDVEQEVLFIPTGESPYYTSFYKMLFRMLDVARRAGDLRVYKDGDLTFGVRPGRFMDGMTEIVYSGESGKALTNNETNSVYLWNAGGTATVSASTSGFPAQTTTRHIPLAVITTSGGNYDVIDDLSDRRAPGIWRLPDVVPQLAITAGAESADERTITVQAQDAAGEDISGRFLIRVWIDDSEYAPPDSAGNTVSIDTGTIYETETANAAYKIITGTDGKIEVGITISGAASRYIMAEIDGRIYSSGEVIWAA